MVACLTGSLFPLQFGAFVNFSRDLVVATKRKVARKCFDFHNPFDECEQTSIDRRTNKTSF